MCLVEDFETIIHQRGSTTIYLGADGEESMPALATTDLHPDEFQHIAEIKNPKRHPYRHNQSFHLLGRDVVENLYPIKQAHSWAIGFTIPHDDKVCLWGNIDDLAIPPGRIEVIRAALPG